MNLYYLNGLRPINSFTIKKIVAGAILLFSTDILITTFKCFPNHFHTLS